MRYAYKAVNRQVFINVRPMDAVAGRRHLEGFSLVLGRSGKPGRMLRHVYFERFPVNAELKDHTRHADIPNVVGLIYRPSPGTYPIGPQCSRNARI